MPDIELSTLDGVIRFSGELILRWNGNADQSPKVSRWLSLELYRTAKRIVAVVHYHTTKAMHEKDIDKIFDSAADDPESLVDEILAWDVMPLVSFWPEVINDVARPDMVTRNETIRNVMKRQIVDLTNAIETHFGIAQVIE